MPRNEILCTFSRDGETARIAVPDDGDTAFKVAELFESHYEQPMTESENARFKQILFDATVRRIEGK